MDGELKDNMSVVPITKLPIRKTLCFCSTRKIKLNSTDFRFLVEDKAKIQR